MAGPAKAGHWSAPPTQLDMTAKTPHRPGATGCTLLVLGLALLAPGSSSVAATQIYKCLDKNLGLLYTDEPCKDGELLNIRAGDADPAAVARLERARDALDQSAAQRIADERRAAAQRDLGAWYTTQDEPSAYDYMAANTPYDYGVTWWFPGFAKPHPPRSRPPPQRRRMALMPPSMEPRR
jgi:hypothetical protein